MVGSKIKHCRGHGLKIMLRTSRLIDESSFLVDLPWAFVPFLWHSLGPALGCSICILTSFPCWVIEPLAARDPGMSRAAEIHHFSMEMHTSDGVHLYSAVPRLFLKIWLGELSPLTFLFYSGKRRRKGMTWSKEVIAWLFKDLSKLWSWPPRL